MRLILNNKRRKLKLIKLSRKNEKIKKFSIFKNLMKFLILFSKKSKKLNDKLILLKMIKIII